MNLTLNEIAAACGGSLHGENTRVTELVTDSRKAERGCLFAALKGEKSDGFDFIAGLEGKEGVCYLCDREPANAKNPYIVVPDVLRAVGDIAKLHLKRMSAMRVAVTGSVGKTTTKDFIAAALSACVRTHSSKGNFNNELGLPLSALGTDKSDGALVLEMGMRGFGQIEYLCGIAPPDVAVITNIGVSHLELLGSRENILKAKCEITDGLRPGGTAVLNGDDDMLKDLKLPVKTVFFGIENEKCDIRAVNIVDNSFTAMIYGREYPVKLSVEGRHNIYNALAAVAAGAALGFSPGELIRGISAFAGDGQRQNIIESGGLTFFDDCYNASPASMKAAMEVMSKHPGRKVLVLADMLELGDLTESAHRGLAEDIRKLSPAAVICIGEYMKYLCDELPEAVHCENAEEAMRALHSLVYKGDCILFKGSNAMNLAGLLSRFKLEWKK